MQEQNLKIKEMEVMLKEKDKEIKIQALKIKELLNADRATRQKIIKRDYDMLQ